MAIHAALWQWYPNLRKGVSKLADKYKAEKKAVRAQNNYDNTYYKIQYACPLFAAISHIANGRIFCTNSVACNFVLNSSVYFHFLQRFWYLFLDIISYRFGGSTTYHFIALTFPICLSPSGNLIMQRHYDLSSQLPYCEHIITVYCILLRMYAYSRKDSSSSSAVFVKLSLAPRRSPIHRRRFEHDSSEYVGYISILTSSILAHTFFDISGLIFGVTQHQRSLHIPFKSDHIHHSTRTCTQSHFLPSINVKHSS